MTSQLYELLAPEAASLAETLAHDLKVSLAPHYEETDLRTLSKRCSRLVEALAAAARDEPDRFLDYMRHLAEERASAGYQLRELQRALSLLEERAWELILAQSSIRTLEKNLTALRRLIGGGRDELARTYLAHKEEAEATVAELRQEIEELFKGTDAHVAAEELASGGARERR